MGPKAGAHVAILDALLGKLQLWLLEEVLVRLIQRVWVHAIADIGEAILHHRYVPQALGQEFALRTLRLVDGLTAMLSASGGPSREWFRRRARPLRSVLQLTTLPTTALLKQHSRQAAGPARAATLTALSLRMDDALAAGVQSPTPYWVYVLVYCAWHDLVTASSETPPHPHHLQPVCAAIVAEQASQAGCLNIDGAAPLADAIRDEPSLQTLVDAQLGGENAVMNSTAAVADSSTDAERRMRGLKLVRPQ